MYPLTIGITNTARRNVQITLFTDRPNRAASTSDDAAPSSVR